MSGEGIKAREKFQAAMQAIEPGARLARRSIWTVERQQHRETGIELTLRCGRRQARVHVPICHSGPILWEAGLRPVAPAPMQRDLLLRGGGEA